MGSIEAGGSQGRPRVSHRTIVVGPQRPMQGHGDRSPDRVCSTQEGRGALSRAEGHGDRGQGLDGGRQPVQVAELPSQCEAAAGERVRLGGLASMEGGDREELEQRGTLECLAQGFAQPEAFVGELDPLIELATKDAPGGKLRPLPKERRIQTPSSRRD